MDNFGTGQNQIQQYYNSLRLPQQQGGGAAPLQQGMGGQTPVPQQQQTTPFTPLMNYLNTVMSQAGQNSQMQSMGGFNNPGAQVGLNNISWDAPAAGAATDAAGAGAASAAGGSAAGGGIMSMLASLL